jgi:A/G-specific adenine glycosylase
VCRLLPTVPTAQELAWQSRSFGTAIKNHCWYHLINNSNSISTTTIIFVAMTSRQFFTQTLLQWNQDSNQRQMPWKGEKDPYKIWLSEVILQQTRVEQGLAYYQAFIKNYPTVKDLAKAKDEAVFKLWEGLGYYSRCRNLLATARIIAHDYMGKFPDQYDQIVALKGVGPYTAAAIASFAFNLPHAVVDGNVYRVLSRFFGIDEAIDSTAGKKHFSLLAAELLDVKNPGAYNQSIMDFGATVCKPASPDCEACPLQKKCVALQTAKVALLPIKEKKISKKTRFFHYFLLQHKNRFLFFERQQKDIWQHLFEPLLMETKSKKQPSAETVQAQLSAVAGEQTSTLVATSGWQKQLLTHQTVHVRFNIVQLSQPTKPPKGVWVNKNALDKIAMPRIIRLFADTID